MKLSLKLKVTAIAFAFASTLIIVNPANAAAPGTTPITLAITGSTHCSGTISVNAPGTFALGSVAFNTASSTANAGTVTVADTRCDSLGWATQVQIANLTEAGGSPDILANGALSYSPGNTTRTGSGTGAVTTATADAPFSNTTVVSTTFVTAKNGATWTPTLTLTLDGTAYNGTYTSTVTTSVS